MRRKLAIAALAAALATTLGATSVAGAPDAGSKIAKRTDVGTCC
jgi:hypothetical protein